MQRRDRPDKRVLNERSELIIIDLILECSTLYLDELVKEVNELVSVTVSSPTICRLLKHYSFTRKKVRQI